jgi:hypothetical protein
VAVLSIDNGTVGAVVDDTLGDQWAFGSVAEGQFTDLWDIEPQGGYGTIYVDGAFGRTTFQTVLSNWSAAGDTLTLRVNSESLVDPGIPGEQDGGVEVETLIELDGNVIRLTHTVENVSGSTKAVGFRQFPGFFDVGATHKWTVDGVDYTACKTFFSTEDVTISADSEARSVLVRPVEVDRPVTKIVLNRAASIGGAQWNHSPVDGSVALSTNQPSLGVWTDHVAGANLAAGASRSYVLELVGPDVAVNPWTTGRVQWGSRGAWH